MKAEQLFAPCPLTESEARQAQADCARSYSIPPTTAIALSRGTGIDLVLIPSGEFVMGPPPEVAQESDRLLPPRRVRIDRPFYLGRFPLTQAQWWAVMGANPSRFHEDEHCPVEMVSWQDCIAFCKRASELTGSSLRLPSEAEWEYACRAGTESAYYFGDSAAEFASYGWCQDNSEHCSHPVGLKWPNAWGLHDMHGGIDEYCQDTWHTDPTGAPIDGSPWLQGGNPLYRVLRGGSWYDEAIHCRAFHRNYYDHTTVTEDHGLRIALDVEATAKL